MARIAFRDLNLLDFRNGSGRPTFDKFASDDTLRLSALGEFDGMLIEKIRGNSGKTYWPAARLAAAFPRSSSTLGSTPLADQRLPFSSFCPALDRASMEP